MSFEFSFIIPLLLLFLSLSSFSLSLSLPRVEELGVHRLAPHVDRLPAPLACFSFFCF